MADFLTRLVQRLAEPVLRPRLPSWFEPSGPELELAPDEAVVEQVATDATSQLEPTPVPREPAPVAVQAQPQHAKEPPQADAPVTPSREDAAPRRDVAARVPAHAPVRPPAVPAVRAVVAQRAPTPPVTTPPAPAPERVPAARAAEQSGDADTAQAERAPAEQRTEPPQQSLRPALVAPPTRFDDWPTPPRATRAASEPVIQVTIGRVEVRAVTAREAARTPPPSPVMSLEDYLRSRAR